MAITQLHIKKKDYKKGLYYINRALNIDGENAGYWALCGKIHIALKNLGQAHCSLKKAIALGDRQLDTWLQWANVAIDRKYYALAIDILKKGRGQHPHSDTLLLKLAGVHLMENDQSSARSILASFFEKGFAMDKLQGFKKEFGPYLKSDWIDSILSKTKGTSR